MNESELSKKISLINYWLKKLLEDWLLAVKVVVSLLSNCSVLLGYVPSEMKCFNLFGLLA